MRIVMNPVLCRVISLLPLIVVPIYVYESPLLTWLPVIVLLSGAPFVVWAMTALEILFFLAIAFGFQVSDLLHLSAQSLVLSVFYLLRPSFLNALIVRAETASGPWAWYRGFIYRANLIILILLVCSFVFRGIDPLVLGILLPPHFLIWVQMRHIVSQASRRFDWAGATLFLVMICVCAVILEVGLRVLVPVSSETMDLFIPHPDYIYMLNPGYSAPLSFTPYDKQQRVEIDVRISEQGFRGNSVPKKESGEYRILALGDSYTFGWAVPEEDAFPQQLNALFNDDKAERTIRVINGGMPGSGPWQHYGILLERGLALKPDLIILQTNIANDLIDTARRENFYLETFLRDQERQIVFYRNLSHPRFQLHDRLRKGLRSYYVLSKVLDNAPLIVEFMNQCRLFEVIETPAVPGPLARPWQYEPDLDTWYPELERAWALMKEDLLKFKDQCEKEGIDLLVFNMAVPIDVREADEEIARFPDYNYELYKGYRMVENFCRDNKIAFVPMLEAFEAHPNRSELILPGDGHMSKEGNALVARTLHDYIKVNNRKRMKD